MMTLRMIRLLHLAFIGSLALGAVWLVVASLLPDRPKKPDRTKGVRIVRLNKEGKRI
jgi:hypothetical protein